MGYTSNIKQTPQTQEHIGVTSAIRELCLAPQHYDSLLHFFRSTAWELTSLRNWWIQAVLKADVFYQENGMPDTIAGFAYRFWSVATPKLNRFAKVGTDVLEAVSDARERKHITAAFRTTQGYVMMACIAMDLLQFCSLLFADEINTSSLRWLRTKTNTIPSGAP